MKETNAVSCIGFIESSEAGLLGFRLQLFQIVLKQLCVFGFIFACIFNYWLPVHCKTDSIFPGCIHYLSDRGNGGHEVHGGGGGGHR